MHYIKHEKFAPPQELLDQCYRVVLTRPTQRGIKQWAKENCNSFVYMSVPDFNLVHCVYYFGDEKDAVYFSLKWS